jgi:diacylglycerol kinase (ATP)
LKYFIIVNPISGRGNGARSIPDIRQFFENAGLEFNLITTERPGHALELAKEAVKQGYDVVVSAGGDGTANEILNGMIEANQENGHHACMAVIPVGRGNDFSYGMGVPTDLSEVFECIRADQRRMVDIGRVYGDAFPDGRYFGNGIGIGFDAVVGFEALKLKFLTGFASYIVAALKTIFLYFNPPQLRLITPTDDRVGKYLMISIMNGIRMGGGFYMAPGGNPADGSFDLCVVDAVSRVAMVPLIGKFTKGTQKGDPAVTFLRANRVDIHAVNGSGIPAHADGETVCTNGQSIRVELHPQVLEMIYKPGLR